MKLPEGIHGVRCRKSVTGKMILQILIRTFDGKDFDLKMIWVDASQHDYDRLNLYQTKESLHDKH